MLLRPWRSAFKKKKKKKKENGKDTIHSVCKRALASASNPVKGRVHRLHGFNVQMECKTRPCMIRLEHGDLMWVKTHGTPKLKQSFVSFPYGYNKPPTPRNMRFFMVSLFSFQFGARNMHLVVFLILTRNQEFCLERLVAQTRREE
jgi:hypothetical protein